MNHQEYHHKMEYLKEMLKKEANCSLDYLSKSFGLSKRTIVRMVANLRNDGFNIKFDRGSDTYRLN